jgi:uncharacterized OB-fold protein
MASEPTYFSIHDQPFWESVAQGETRMQRCSACRTYRYPPGACCPNCLSLEAEWAPLSGKGRVLSWTTIHRQYLPAYPAPSTVVVVHLDEGPIMVTHFDNDDVGKLRIDLSVSLTYSMHPDGYRLPKFAPADEGRS